MSQTDTLERTAIVAYTLLQELHRVLADPHSPDEVTQGIILATAMFCDVARQSKPCSLRQSGLTDACECRPA